MKKHVPTIIVILVFLVGLSVLLYPTISNLVNERNQSRVITDYQGQVGNLREEEYAQILADAQAYNAAHSFNDFSITEEEASADPVYQSLLSVNGSAIMGYLDIPKINVTLPIYHGASETVLQTGIGHLPQTSLPVGGVGTHCVVSGHTGLPAADLLTDLDQMAVGDLFQVHVLNETFTYEVDQILVVEPAELGALAIDKEMDYLTLVTCTPYGVNSHRLLVRGHRVENPPELAAERTAAAAQRLVVYRLAVAIPVAIAAVVVVVLVTRRVTRRKEK
ncbi:MAG: class C sortase [Oscillospiraceae bacterium]|nr:class C sortase [Oscillospiraceae bacterium]